MSRVVVTGASGFLGEHVARAIHRLGHQVTSVVRRSSAGGHLGTGVGTVQADLRDRRSLSTAFAEAEVVVHLAARLDGDFHQQFEGTVVGTENLLRALPLQCRLILVSSIAVYRFRQLRSGDLLTEDVALEDHPEDRDPYCWTKLEQERLVRNWSSNLEFCVVRPGIVFGRSRLYSDRIGLRTSNRLLVVGGDSVLPLTYVENCAEAIAGLVSEFEHSTTFNVIDDERLTQVEYLRLLDRITGVLHPRTVIPRAIIFGMARAIWSANSRIFGARLHLPFEASYPRLQAIFQPLRYSNEAIRATGWQPRFGLESAMAASSVRGERAF